MKLKKSISIILSAVMISNLACSYSAQISAKRTKNQAEITVVEGIRANEDLTADKEIVSECVTIEPKLKQPTVSNRAGSNNEGSSNSLSRKELIDKFLLKNSKYLPQSKIRDLASKLQKLSDEDIYKLSSISLHNPKYMPLISLLFGYSGIDRILIGKIGTGILKFLCNGLVIPGTIWWLVDIFKIRKLTKQQNWEYLKKEIQNL